MIILGIDPGKSGGIAWTSGHGAMMAQKMPATEQDLAMLLQRIKGRKTMAYIERVHATPQMGVTSAFTFGRNYGTLRGILAASHIPFEEVTPAKWIRAYGLKKDATDTPSQWKNKLKQKAQNLFPSLSITLSTADAILISEYGRRIQSQRGKPEEA